MSASPGSAPISVVSCGSTPRQPARQVHRVDGLGGETRPAGQGFAVGGDHDVGDCTVHHISGIEHHRADLGALGQPFQGITVGFARREQRQLRQRGAKQRSRYQRLAELLEHDGGIREFAARAAQLLGHHQCRGADLFAQQLPQRLVVAEF